MKVLVTGATGFIGRYVVEELLKRGHHVIATGVKETIDLSRFSNSHNVEYLSYDTREVKQDLFNYFKRPDKIIHLAWQGLPNYKELFHFERNLFQNYSFIKTLVSEGLKDITVIGTCAEYGMQEGSLKEEMHTDPVTPYALAKDTLRKFLHELSKKETFSFRWIRIFYLYGIGQAPNSILSQLDKALDSGEESFNMSGGEQLRDYLPVEKVAEYIAKISLQEEVLGIINCCSGEPISIKQLVKNHLKKRGKMIRLNLGYYPYPDYEPMAFWGDNKKLKKALKIFESKKG